MHKTFLCFLLLLRSHCCLAHVMKRKSDRPISIRNKTNKMILVFWINERAIAYHKQAIIASNKKNQGSPSYSRVDPNDMSTCSDCYISQIADDALYPKSTQHLNSFVGHRFQVRQKCYGDSSDGFDPRKADNDVNCPVGYFTVSENDSQMVTISVNNLEEFRFDDLNVEFEDDVSRTRGDVNTIIASCMGDNDNLNPSCVQEKMGVKLQEVQAELEYAENLRKTFAPMIENYTCADFEMPTTKALRSEVFLDETTGQKVSPTPLTRS